MNNCKKGTVGGGNTVTDVQKQVEVFYDIERGKPVPNTRVKAFVNIATKEALQYRIPLDTTTINVDFFVITYAFDEFTLDTDGDIVKDIERVEEVFFTERITFDTTWAPVYAIPQRRAHRWGNTRISSRVTSNREIIITIRPIINKNWYLVGTFEVVKNAIFPEAQLQDRIVIERIIPPILNDSEESDKSESRLRAKKSDESDSSYGVAPTKESELKAKNHNVPFKPPVRDILIVK